MKEIAGDSSPITFVFTQQSSKNLNQEPVPLKDDTDEIENELSLLVPEPVKNIDKEEKELPGTESQVH